ncbi:Elongation of very long chain fatty acids protein 6 [Orchesella cincta]|uniref:Elongation of very long chain fatty acids protein n=1 Tax=Orchesella cincta TaxID=48709 RepID=A0A1D2MWY1_ORCCI|nr:Elongation of very long chain fatty acids protein 6 [Orchesella cincta]
MMTHNTSSDSYYMELAEQKPFGYSVTENPYFKGFEFEKVDLFWWQRFASENWKLGFYAGALYIAAIFCIQNYMKNRPAFELKRSLFWWNLTIGILSMVGFVRTLPGFLTVLTKGGFYNSICVKDGFDIPTGYWCVAFTISKYVELGDTIFIVLRKRPLIFLQWYHHVITLIAVWLTGPLVEPISRWYVVLNCMVHALMYPYFSLRAVNVKVPVYVANIITTLQFSQMLIGFSVNMTSWYLRHNGYDCARDPLSINVFAFVYGSFILLFGKLFYDSVIKSGRKLKEKKKQG